jgi:DNA-binding CsgD family transcriptional regulator
MLNVEVLMTAGRGDLMRAAARRHFELAEEMKQPSHRWYAGVIQTILLLLEGDLDAAERRIAETRAAGERAQAWDAGASYAMALTMLRWEQGRLGEAEATLREAVAEYPGYRLFTCILALLYSETDRADLARGIVRSLVTGGEGVMPLDNGWLFGMTLLAEVIAALDDVQLAHDAHTALAPFADLVGSGAGEVVSGSAHRPVGLMLAVLGRYDEAFAHFEAARPVHRSLGSDLWAAHTDVDHAWALLRRGGSDDLRAAAVILDRARRPCERRRLVRLLDRIDAMASQVAAAAGDGGRAARPGGLTKREVEVAILVSRGASNRDIADTLVVSERTAETHVQNILTKLGFGSRAKIAGWAVEQGLGGSGP